ncbi:MAG: zinc-ribbon domain-containing protein [Acutalibacteraceae bacterium]
MQKCYNCGKEVDDNVLICPDCGALVKRYGSPGTGAGGAGSHAIPAGNGL